MVWHKILNYDYDPSVDALYIQVEDHQNPKAIPLNDNVIIDFTKEGKLTGLEILNTSYVLNTTVESLKNITSIDLIVKVTEYQILVNAIFTLDIHNHSEFKITNTTVINDNNIPTMDAKLATA
ncbi:MAG: DUF2283 domain-containing protein [Methanobacteriaceae archaeon]|jgi:uncharacterized protein YuzE|nr:DUF2283 domain-containing protein [Candidatus Methanorudis spinitermitis]